MESEAKIERTPDAKRLQLKSWTCQNAGRATAASTMPSITGMLSTAKAPARSSRDAHLPSAATARSLMTSGASGHPLR